MGDRDFEVDLLSDFVGSTRELLDQLDELVEGGDLEGAVRTAHTLKGCCRNVGALPLGLLGERLETAAREGDAAEAESLLVRLHAAFEELKAFAHSRWGGAVTDSA